MSRREHVAASHSSAPTPPGPRTRWFRKQNTTAMSDSDIGIAQKPRPAIPSARSPTFHEPHLCTSPIFLRPPALTAHGTVAMAAQREAESWPRGKTAQTYMAKTRCEGERALEAARYLEDLIEFDRRPRHGRTRSTGADHEQLPARHRQARKHLDQATPRTRQTRYLPPPRRQAAPCHTAPGSLCRLKPPLARSQCSVQLGGDGRKLVYVFFQLK